VLRHSDRRLIALALLLAAVPLLGIRCPTDVQMCEYHTDCPLPDYCLDQWKCGARGCTTDDDCPDGIRCLQAQGYQQPSCHRPDPATGRFVCRDDDGCPVGKFCEPADIEGAYTGYIGLCMPDEERPDDEED
jgi:hypothetical protein